MKTGSKEKEFYFITRAWARKPILQFNCVYTVQFEEFVYILHAFQKKSKTGIKTTKQDIDLVKQRLSVAKVKYGEWLKESKR